MPWGAFAKPWEFAPPEEAKQYQKQPPPQAAPDPSQGMLDDYYAKLGEGLGDVGLDPSSFLPKPQQQPQNTYSLPGADVGFPVYQPPDQPQPQQDSGGGLLGKLSGAASDIGSALTDYTSPQGFASQFTDPLKGIADLRDATGSSLGVVQDAGHRVSGPVLGSMLDQQGNVDTNPLHALQNLGSAELNANPLYRIGSGLVNQENPYSDQAAQQYNRFQQSDAPIGVKVGAGILSDPTTYVGPGLASKLGPLRHVIGQPLEAGLGAAFGAGAAAQGAETAGLPDWAQQAAPFAGAIVGGGIGGHLAETGQVAKTAEQALSSERGSFDTTGAPATPEVAGAPPEVAGAVSSPVPPADLAESILDLPKPTPPPLTRTDVVMNRVKEAIGVPQSNEIAQTAVDYRKQYLPVVESQANALSTQVDNTLRQAFKIGKDGRVEDIVGRPFIQDIAARLPDFQQYLTPEQLAAMEDVRTRLTPYKAVLDRAGIEVGSRTDVQDGGFYMPRGRADLEGADAAVKVGSGRGGGKAGFEKGAKFESMAQGADAGYEYAPLAEAINSYAKDAGQRAIDTHVADYFKQARDGAGKLIGETPADRMDQVIKAQWEDVNQRLLSVRGKLETAEQRAGISTGKGDELAGVLEKQATGSSIPLDPSPRVARDINRFITRAEQRITALRQKGQGYAETADNLSRDLAAIKDERANLHPDYQLALDEARATPRTQGTIALPRSAALNGWTFPDEVATAMQNALNHEKPLMGRGSTPLKAVQAFNNITRGLKATGDISFTGIQGLIGAARDPIGYGKAMAVAFKSMADPQALGAYLNDMDAKYAAKGLPSIAEKVKNGLHIGGADTEYSIKTGLSGKIDSIVNGGKINPFRGSNRSFGYFGDVMRNELADLAYENGLSKGFDMADPKNFKSAMDVANRATGWSPNTFGGDLGQLGMFAPRFFQSQLEYLATSAESGTVGGMEARRGLVRLLGLSVGLTVLGNEATGRAIPYTEMFNPQSSNFMRFRVGGQDVSVLGPWDSLLRSAISLGPLDLDRDLATMSGIKGNLHAPDPSYILRTKASPAVALAWDQITGKTFTGDDARTPGSIAQQLFVPFSMQDVTNQNPLQTAIGTTGLKSTPETPSEQLNGIARAKYGQDYADLMTSQQKQIQSDHPDTYLRYQQHQSSDTQKYNAQKEVYAQQQSASDAALLSGKMSPSQYKTEMDSRRDKMEGVGTTIYGDKTVDNPTNWKQRYGNILRTNTTATGTVDWAKVDDAVASLSADDQAHITDNRGAKGTPLQQLRSQISQEYYNLPQYRGYTADQGFKLNEIDNAVKNLSRDRRGQPGDELAQLRALDKYAQQNSIAKTSPAYIGERRQILGILQQDNSRKNYAAKHPEIALVTGNAPLNQQQIQAIQRRLGSTQ